MRIDQDLDRRKIVQGGTLWLEDALDFRKQMREVFDVFQSLDRDDYIDAGALERKRVSAVHPFVLLKRDGGLFEPLFHATISVLAVARVLVYITSEYIPVRVSSQVRQELSFARADFENRAGLIAEQFRYRGIVGFHFSISLNVSLTSVSRNR